MNWLHLSFDALLSTTAQVLATIIVGWIAYRAGAQATRQALKVDLKRSLMDKASRLQELAFECISLDPVPQAIKERVESVWQSIEVDFEVVRRDWNPTRNDTNDERLKSYSTDVQNFKNNMNGGAGNLERAARLIRREASCWPI